MSLSTHAALIAVAVLAASLASCDKSGGTPACSGHVEFSGPPVIPLPRAAMALGDLDGDGITDLVTAGIDLTTSRGRGDGSFEPPTSYSLTINPQEVQIADLDGDGRPDIIVPYGDYARVAVFLDEGNFTLGPEHDYLTGMAADHIAVGDLDGDRRPDLAVLDTRSGTVGILLNDGAGQFSNATEYATSMYARDLAIGDLDGDGHGDLVVADAPPSMVSVFLGDGTGQLAPAVAYPAGASIESVALGDVTGDGKPDIVVPVLPPANASTVLAVLANRGDGSFAAPATYPVDIAGKVWLSDLNGDNRVDAVLGELGRSGIAVLVGDGNGFAPAKTYYATPFDFAVGDVNGDDRPDVLVSGDDIDELLNRGDGSLAEPERIPGSDVAAITTMDVDRDGSPDLVTTDETGVSVFANDGRGQFLSPVTYAVGSAQDVLVRDMNRDGNADLLLSSDVNGGVSALINHGGRFGAPIATATAERPLCTALVDLDKDTRVDLVTTTGDVSQDLYGLSIQLGDGSGGFGPPTMYAAPYARCVATADLNHDDWPDVVIGPSRGRIGVLLNQRDGTLGPEHDFWLTNATSPVVLVDIDHDSNIDVVGGAGVVLGHSDGTFGPPIPLPGYETSPTRFDRVAVRDLDGDGKLDLVDTLSDVVLVARGHGDGSFDPPTWYATAGARGLAIVDLDGDGRPDIVTSGNDGITLLRNSCVP